MTTARPTTGGLRAAVVGLVGVLAVAGCTAQQPPRGGQAAVPGAASIQVDLFGTRDDVVGTTWPTGSTGAPLSGAAIQEPHVVEIDVGEATPLRFASQLTFLDADLRPPELAAVTVQPPDQLLAYAEALDAVASDLDGNGLLDERASARLAEFEAQGAGDEGDDWPARPRRRTLGVETATGVQVFTELRPHVAGDGWYYTITVARPLDQGR